MVNISSADRPGMRARFWIGLAAVVLIGFGALAGALLMRADDSDDFHRGQREEAARAADQAEAVAALSIGQLDGLAAFAQADGDPGRHEFDVVGRTLLKQDVLNATAYLPLVRGSERAAYEAEQGLEITERTEAAPLSLRRADVHPAYVPLTYVVAEGETEKGRGFDLWSDPERSPFLRRARDSDRAVATPVVQLLLGGRGINVYRAIYRDGAPIGTVAERRRALVGFVAASYRFRDLAATAASALGDDSETQLRIDGRTEIGSGGDLDDAAASQIQIADRTWVLVVRDPDRPDISLPLLIGVVGIAVAALLGSLILSWSRRERIEELQREAGEDPLTGLKNRRRFEQDMRAAMARARRERNTGAMLMLDLDHFKQVNDTAGHPAGDKLIEEIADVLRNRTRASDSLARLGGDEFAVMLPHCSREEALLTAEAIVKSIREHPPRGEGVEPITASVGVALFGDDPRVGYDSIVSRSDSAMYAAKDGGRDGVRIFDPLAVREEGGGA
jgi:diguanylate cyclase (GGDEF)-like protein